MMKTDDFDISKEKTPDGAKFTLKGRLNSINADLLESYMEEALKGGEVHIILNMLWVEYLSSAGIRVIIKTYKDAKNAGGSFEIEKPSQSVRNVLGMTALDQMLIK